jgi:hypothetical protein
MEDDDDAYLHRSIAPLSQTYTDLDSLDQDLLELFGEDAYVAEEMGKQLEPSATGPLPDVALSMEKPKENGKSHRQQPDPELVKQLNESLASLPEPMQKLFVERLVSIATDPEAFKVQVEAVSALAAAAAEQAKQMSVGTSEGENAAAVALPLATASLGAFLAQYSAAMKQIKKKNNNNEHPPVVPMRL